MSTLIEILSRDPHDCSKQDIAEVVKYYREKRAQFNLGNLTAGKTISKQTKGEAEAAQVTKNLNISDML